MIEYAEEIGEENAAEADDPDRWLRVDCESSRPGYRDMEWFVADIDNLRLRRCGGRVGRAEPAGRAAGRQGAAVLTAPLNIGVGQK